MRLDLAFQTVRSNRYCDTFIDVMIVQLSVTTIQLFNWWQSGSLYTNPVTLSLWMDLLIIQDSWESRDTLVTIPMLTHAH